MKILAHTINKILLQHCLHISKQVKCDIIGNQKKFNIDYIKDVSKVKIIKNEVLFIYNTSLANFLTSFISSFFGSKVIFHLHDPIPHSGLLNPILYILNFLQILISDKVFLFSEELRKETLKAYLVKNKRIRILKHGSPDFKFNIKVKNMLNKKKINIGFFGRNVAYKNVNYFIEQSIKYKDIDFHIVGEGYEGLNHKENVIIHNGFIDNDIYYSLMLVMDYISLPYKQVSFSGVISDCINLNKKMIVSNVIFQKYKDKNMIQIKDFKDLKSLEIDKERTFEYEPDWKDYSNELLEIDL